jgi:hypothetical protein
MSLLMKGMYAPGKLVISFPSSSSSSSAADEKKQVEVYCYHLLSLKWDDTAHTLTYQLGGTYDWKTGAPPADAPYEVLRAWGEKPKPLLPPDPPVVLALSPDTYPSTKRAVDEMISGMQSLQFGQVATYQKVVHINAIS